MTLRFFCILFFMGILKKKFIKTTGLYLLFIGFVLLAWKILPLLTPEEISVNISFWIITYTLMIVIYLASIFFSERIINILWIILFGISTYILIKGIQLDDFAEIFNNATILCLSCTGIQ